MQCVQFDSFCFGNYCEVYFVFNVKKIFYLLDCLGIDQKEFAEKIGVAKTVVSKWNKGQLGSYTKYYSEIMSFFDISPEFFFEQGVFKNWDDISKNAEAVYFAMRDKINASFIDPLADEDTCLEVWLDKNMNYGAFGSADELKTIRWFSHRVAAVNISAGEHSARPVVEVVFKDDFQQQLERWSIDNPPSKDPSVFSAQDLADDFLRRMQEPPEMVPIVSNLDTKEKTAAPEGDGLQAEFTRIFDSLSPQTQKAALAMLRALKETE